MTGGNVVETTEEIVLREDRRVNMFVVAIVAIMM